MMSIKNQTLQMEYALVLKVVLLRLHDFFMSMKLLLLLLLIISLSLLSLVVVAAAVVS